MRRTVEAELTARGRFDRNTQVQGETVGLAKEGRKVAKVGRWCDGYTSRYFLPSRII